MQYFSGFGLQNEYCLFAPLLENFGFKLTEFDIVGFDYGAQLALDYAYERIANNQRIGKIVLLSPCIHAHNLFWFDWDKTNNPCIWWDNAQDFPCCHVLKPEGFITHANLHYDSKCAQCTQDSKKDFTKTNRKAYKKIMAKFIAACIYHYINAPNQYMQNLYKSYGFSSAHANESFCKNLSTSEYFTHYPKTRILGNLLHYKWDKITKVAKKTKLLVIFCGKNDRIVNSNLALNFFSQFGHCFLLHSCNHLLRHKSL